MWDATQGVCCLIFTPSAQDVGALSVVFVVTGFLQVHTCTERANEKYVRRLEHEPHSDFGAGIHVVMKFVLARFVFLREASGRARKLELFAKFRKKRAGRSGILCCVSGTDKDGRHDILHEVTRHGQRVSCHDTIRNMTARTASTLQARGALRHAMPCRVIALRFARTALRDRPRPEWHREERRPCGAITFTRSPRCATDGLRSCVFVRGSMRAARFLQVLATYENITRQTRPSP